MFVITFINYYHRHRQHYSSSLAVEQTFSWLSKYVELSFLHEMKPKNKVRKGFRIKYNMRKKRT